MEPLKSSASDDDCLEALLRERMPALRDDGFSARVLAALPPPEKSPIDRRLIFSLVGGMVGGIFALLAALLWPGAQADLTSSLTAIAQPIAVLMDPGVGLALLVATASLVYAFRHEARARVLA